MAFEGSCHCGAVRFRADAETPTKALSCNCTHCRRKGVLLAFIPAEKFTLLSGEAQLRDYNFNTGRITHRFCAVCGVEPFAQAIGPDGVDTRALNLRAVMEIDLDALEIEKVNGLEEKTLRGMTRA